MDGYATILNTQTTLFPALKLVRPPAFYAPVAVLYVCRGMGGEAKVTTWFLFVFLFLFDSIVLVTGVTGCMSVYWLQFCC